MSSNSPIVLFVYNRVGHVEKVLRSIQNATGGFDSKLYIISDGPRSKEDVKLVEEVRSFIRSENWTQEIIIIEKEKNYGVGVIIPETLDNLFQTNPTLIILEDDTVLGEEALLYFNKCLIHHEENKGIFKISGYVPPIEYSNLPDLNLMDFGSCWGWATWADRWKVRQKDAFDLIQDVYKDSERFKVINNLPVNFFQDVINVCDGSLNTWAAVWEVYNILNRKKAIVPNQSFIQNIGHDESGMHSSLTKMYEVIETKRMSNIDVFDIKDGHKLLEKLEDFFGSNNGYLVSKKNTISLILKEVLTLILNKEKRSWKINSFKIENLRPYERFIFNWLGSKFCVINKESFLCEHKLFFNNLFISSFDIKQGLVIDFNPNEGVFQKFIDKKTEIENQLICYETIDYGIDILKYNLDNICCTYLSFNEIKIKMESSASIAFIKLSNDEKTLNLFLDNIHKISHFLIHFKFTRSDYSQLNKVISILNQKYILSIDDFGLLKEQFFRLRYKKHSSIFITGLKRI